MSPMNPPTNEPTSPSTMVPRTPIASRPGTIARAMNPATKPTSSHHTMFNVASSSRSQVKGCYPGTRSANRRGRAGRFLGRRFPERHPGQREPDDGDADEERRRAAELPPVNGRRQRAVLDDADHEVARGLDRVG